MFDAIEPGTVITSPDNTAIGVRNRPDNELGDWTIIDPYNNHSTVTEQEIEDWIVRFAPGASV